MGGSGGGDTESTVHQSNLPEWSKPFHQDVMRRAQTESLVPYVPYEGQRVAELTPAQKSIASRIYGASVPSYYESSEFASEYGPTDFSANFDPASFQSSYIPTEFQSMFNATDFSNIANSYLPKKFLSQYGITDFESQYEAVDVDPGKITQEDIDYYSSPYQQNVTDVAKREAQRASDIHDLSLNAEAEEAGAFGNSRHGVQLAENDRNTKQLLSDLQVQGSQNAYTAAIEQFNNDREARFQATGMAESYKQFADQMQMQADYYDDQSKQFFAQSNLQADLYSDQSQQYGSGLNLQAAMAGDQSRQYADQAQMQAAMAGDQSRQFGSNLDFQAQVAGDQSRQFGANLDFQAQVAGDQSRQAAEDFRMQAMTATEQSKQFSAAYAQNAAEIQQAQLALAYAVSKDEYDLAQKKLDKLFEDFINIRDYERNQIAFYSAVIRGTPIPVQSETIQYNPGQDPMAQALSAGIGGLGLGNNAAGGG